MVSTTAPPSGGSTQAAAGLTTSTIIDAGNVHTVSADQTISNPVIDNGTLVLDRGAILDGPITFAAGGTGLLFDSHVAFRPDTVVGFTEGSDFLRFAGETAETETATIASAQLVNAGALLTFPDHSSILLAGVSHVDTGIFG